MKKKDIIKALREDGARLHNNGSPIPKFFVVWGNWERYETVRYDTFYALRNELPLIRLPRLYGIGPGEDYMLKEAGI